MSFKKINLIKPIQNALIKEGYETPTPIQEKAIPIILEGKDIMGCAQTGTGKTAAFALPILNQLTDEKKQKFSRRILRALVVTPTRELAIQIGESFSTYGKLTGLKNVVVYGGVRQNKQTEQLKKGVDILVATPGRLLDLVDQGYIQLHNVQKFVLDEADTMLDMGFIHDIRKIISHLPKQRQSMFFSATMSGEITKLARTILTRPVKVNVSPKSSTADTVQQKVYFVERENKKALLVNLLQDSEIKSALVFTRTKYGADKVTKLLNKSKIKSEAIHGNKTQHARQKALANFKNNKTRILVATDIAARGIDIDNLSHVINFELPNIPESYVHRIGRTGRAGLNGIALSFCDQEEREYLNDIQKLISKRIPVAEEVTKVKTAAPENPIDILAESVRIKISGSKKFKYNKPNIKNKKSGSRRKLKK